MKRTFITFLACVLLTGCFRSVKKSEVVGRYELDQKTDFLLEIKSDGTYVHTKITNDGTRIVRTGAWKWDGSDTDNPMYLDSFQIFPGEGIGASDKPTIFILHPEYSVQGVRFPVGDPDAPSHYFIKQKQG